MDTSFSKKVEDLADTIGNDMNAVVKEINRVNKTLSFLEFNNPLPSADLLSAYRNKRDAKDAP